MEVDTMDNNSNNAMFSMADIMNQFGSEKNIFDFVSANIQKMTEQATKAIESEIDRRAQEKYEEMVRSLGIIPKDDKISDGRRKIIVSYDPAGDVNDLGYVKIEVEPEKNEDAMDDAVALVLAAAKRLALASEFVDEDVIGKDLMGVLNDYMFGILMTKIFGGAFNGNH